MPRIRGKETKSELKLKDFFEKKKFAYQPNEYGKPDFIHYRKKLENPILKICFALLMKE